MKWLDRLFGGRQDMAALGEGTKAPDFSLPVSGWQQVLFARCASAWASAGHVLQSFLPRLPICFPVFRTFAQNLRERESRHGGGFSGRQKQDGRILEGVWQSPSPRCLTTPPAYAASNAYGLTNVPSWFLIAPDGEIKISSVGWIRSDVEALNRSLADANHTAPRRLFLPGDDVRDSRPG